MSRYFHVTDRETWAAIRKEGLRPSPGPCGLAVYLFDDADLAFEYAEDMRYEGRDPVVIAIDSSVPVPCPPGVGKREGDSAYYEHVAIVRIRAGGWWKPAPAEMKLVR